MINIKDIWLKQRQLYYKLENYNITKPTDFNDFYFLQKLY